jgi:hypothetical protein
MVSLGDVERMKVFPIPEDERKGSTHYERDHAEAHQDPGQHLCRGFERDHAAGDEQSETGKPASVVHNVFAGGFCASGGPPKAAFLQ